MTVPILDKGISIRTSVDDAYPQRIRHTFAIKYLRNGGDVITLQLLLGHSTLDMVRKYIKLANADDENTHRRASPGDRRHL